MLSGKGFQKVFNVSGGIKAWQAEIAIGPQDLGLDLFTGKEDPLEVLKIAYSLEQGLRDFYIDMEKQAKKPKVKELFARLSEIEVKHQMSIYIAYNDAGTDDISKDEFEKMVEIKALEGGLSTKEYIELFGSDLDSEMEVISLAMSIEAQALDLYERLSLTITNQQSKDIVMRIASEEKAHLASLGKLMDTL